MYWNQTNFEGLKQLVKVLRRDNRCVAFADYCEQRAQGLRKEALKSLSVFLAEFETWTADEQREWSSRLMELQLAHHEVHQLIAHPLQAALIKVFEAWAETDVSIPSPCRWLGVLTHDVAWFEKALERNEDDEYSRWRVANDRIDLTEHACHHIPEYFIGEPADAVRWLDEAEGILEPIADTDRGHSALEKLRQARQKLQDWIEFQATGETSFDEWCKRERGYTWKHPIVVYYEK